MKDVVKNLEAALKVVSRKNGWIKGTRNDGRGRHCALGAIEKVTGKYVLGCTPEAVALEAAIPATVKKKMEAGMIDDPYNMIYGTCQLSSAQKESRIACYNNTTSQKTVVSWFKRAIKMQREHPMKET